jgi:two-component system cell cycle sensor histidine kinase/response regulator CckA
MIEPNDVSGPKFIRALLLEDNAADAELSLRQLRRDGFQVDAEIVRTPDEFKERIRGGTYDIVLGDNRLPGWTGMEAVQWLRGEGYDLPFILVSGTLGDDVAVECIKLGVTDYVIKDRLGRLSVAVRRALGDEQLRRQRTRSEETLREYERVVESLEEMVLVVDRQYRYSIANRAFLNFRGMSREQVVGRTAGQVVGEEIFATLVKGKMDECFRGIPVHYEMTYDFPNLGNRDLSVSYFPIEGPAGVDRIACVLRDITERKLAEEALRKSEERFSKAFRNNPLAITISTEAEGRYLDVNNAFLALLGYARKDVIGRTGVDLHVWGEPVDRPEMLRQLQQGERVAKRHNRYRTAKGEIREAEEWVESIELDGQRCVLGITRDVTEIQQLEAQFRQAQKMEAVGRLAGGIAHDFNNVLGIIMGYSDLSLGLIAPESPLNRYISETKKAANRAASLTKQLLAFSSKQVVFPRILDLNDVVRNATSMFQRLVGEDIAVEFRAATSLGSIDADPGQIEQILMNLVVNARDAMPRGGKILIETAQAEMDERYVSQHPGSIVGEHVVLKVSDTGCGMDETVRLQIFEPFFTTKGGQGTGLGLSTVYGIVKQSGGSILVYSELGKGTTFKVFFPRVHERAEQFALSEEIIEPPRGTETVLVVEDDKTLRAITVKLLQDGGYRVVEAQDAENALKIMARSDPGIDLLLTDVIMPGTSGAELVKKVAKDNPNLRSLFMSGYTSDLVGRHGVSIQEASFLEKPFTKRLLLTKVYAALHGDSAQPQKHLSECR